MKLFHYKNIGFLLILLLLTNRSICASTIPTLTFFSAGEFSQLKGYSQIPRGGIPGTSSFLRPTFSELGIDNAGSKEIFFQTGIVNDWSRYETYLNYQHLRPESSCILADRLMTHGIEIDKDTPLKVNYRFDLYQLGFGYKYYFPNIHLVTFPEAELTFFDFMYDLTSAQKFSNRKFREPTMRVGLGGEFILNPFLSVYFNAASSLPTELQIQTAQVDLRYKILKLKQLQLSLFVGLGYQNIYFKDRQPMPNKVLIKLWPLGRTGITLTL